MSTLSSGGALLYYTDYSSLCGLEKNAPYRIGSIARAYACARPCDPRK